MMKRALALGRRTLLWIGAGPNVAAQTPAGPAFEVASVKPSNPNPDPATRSASIALMLPQPGGRLTATNMPLRMLIMAAYELKQDAQLTGGPPALLAAKYDITAQAADRDARDEGIASVAAVAAGRPVQAEGAHRVARAAAVRPGAGPQRRPPRSGPQALAVRLLEGRRARRGAGAALAKGDVASFVGKPRPCSVSTDPSGGPLNLLMRGDGQEMKSLVEVLSQFTGRTVRDKTGLTGRYDFAMKLDLQMVLALAQRWAPTSRRPPRTSRSPTARR
jgi:hypothetical protein